MKDPAETVAQHDELLARLSHELRNPISAVLGWAELLLESTGLTPELEHGLGVICRNATAQLELLDKLRDVALCTHAAPQFTAGALDRVVRDAIDSIQPAAIKRGVLVVDELRPGLPQAHIDSQRILQVVTNLLTNAVKFSNPGGHVWVRARREGEFVELEIEDSGPGIEPELLPHLGEAYRQGKSGREAQTGLGLGLAIAKRIVDRHAGSLTFRNVYGGALAVLRLRCADAAHT